MSDFLVGIYDFTSMNILVEIIYNKFMCINELVKIVFIHFFSWYDSPSATAFQDLQDKIRLVFVYYKSNLQNIICIMCIYTHYS